MTLVDSHFDFLYRRDKDEVDKCRDIYRLSYFESFEGSCESFPIAVFADQLHSYHGFEEIFKIQDKRVLNRVIYSGCQSIFIVLSIFEDSVIFEDSKNGTSGLRSEKEAFTRAYVNCKKSGYLDERRLSDLRRPFGVYYEWAEKEAKTKSLIEIKSSPWNVLNAWIDALDSWVSSK